MKFKQAKNKKTKTHVKFNAEDRKDYLLGFRKRKLERREKARLELVEEAKKEKRDMKVKRMEFIQKMIDDREIAFGDDEEDEKEDGSQESGPVVTEYGSCTVEVSDLDLKTKSYLGVNKASTASSSHKPSSSHNPSSSDPAMDPSLKIPSGKISGRTIKTSIWKSASKQAKKQIKSIKKKTKSKNKKKRKLVTTL